jgi:vitamin B12 transporter
MLVSSLKSLKLWVCFLLIFNVLATVSRAQSESTLRGRVTDPLGNVLPGATITVLLEGKELAHGSSNAEGAFTITLPGPGRYSVQVEAQGFATQTISSVLVTSGHAAEISVSLAVRPLLQEVVVSATGTAVPETQVGASVSVIDESQIETLNKVDVLENLRLVTGAQVVQTSQRGGTTSLFIRGGDADFNKILVDGIPVNEIGGAFSFAQLANNGISNLEVLRGSNSVLYGSDALSGVVNITSTRGSTIVPEFKYAGDAGNFGTYRNDASLRGAFRRFDYATEFSRFNTNGSLPNDYFHNSTVSANVGWNLNSTTEFRITLRHAAAGVGVPNALDFFGIPDDSTQKNNNTYVGATVQQQTGKRWHNLAQFAFAQFDSVFLNPSPTGEPFDPFAGTPFDFGPNFLGKLMTIRGANAFSATGQAILDFGGTYPQNFPDYEARRSIYLQSDYRFFNDWTGIAGFRYEHENGEGIRRGNYTSFLQGHGSLGHRLFATAGVGLEHNSFFGFAASPRLSLAYYLRQPARQGLLGETKLKFNFGQGIKEASTFQQSSALISLLTPAQIAQFSVSPIGPERSRTYDFGFEQRLWNGRALFGTTFFYNRFYDLIAFLNPSALISIGVPSEAANSTAIGGAYVNATSERGLGSELEFKIDLGHGLLFQGTYTYLDAVVTKAFGSPVFNPAFPTIPIGAFSPLEGARPFRRAPHSGNLALFYNRNKLSAALTGYLVSRRDDSTFLSDPFFGNTLLLPNRNLAPSYQKFDLSVDYAVRRYLSVYTSMENLLSQRYAGAVGFPATPFAIRAGLKFTLGGGENWHK